MRLKQAVLVVGDVVIMYGALVLTIALRIPLEQWGTLGVRHLDPFSALFGLWIIIFYSAGMYDIRQLRTRRSELFATLCIVMGINIVLGTSFFYLVPSIGITPKTNLLLISSFVGIGVFVWRQTMRAMLMRRSNKTPLVIVGDTPAAAAVASLFETDGVVGYTLHAWERTGSMEQVAAVLEPLMHHESTGNGVVVAHHLRTHQDDMRTIYSLMEQGVALRDLDDLHEELFGKIALTSLNDQWILEHTARRPTLYDEVRHLVERGVAILMQLIVIPLELVIGALILLTMGRPVIFAQTRIGRYGVPFTIYKFRTMAQHEGGGSYVTWLGGILRHTHLDELPQLWNIIRGDLSIVGPRPLIAPEQHAFEQLIPYYRARQLTKPGVTGWAQIHYRHGASAEDAHEKLGYDLYYLKHRSLALDTAIVLRSLKTLVTTPR